MAWNIKFIKYRENKLIATKYVQNVRHRHEHKHASMFAIGHHSRFHSARYVATKLTRPQSGGLCHLVCHSATSVWDQSSWHRWVATASTACMAWLKAVAGWWRSWPMANLCACVLVFVPVADILNILCDVNLFSLYLMNFMFTPCLMQHVIFKECIIKVWNVMFSFSLGSVSTSLRWGGHFCHVRVKHFFLLTTVQKLWMSIKIFQSYDHICSATFLWFTLYLNLNDLDIQIHSQSQKSINYRRLSFVCFIFG